MVAGLKPFRMVSLAANKVGWCIFGSAFDASLLSTCMSPASKAMNTCDLDLCTPRTACFVLARKLESSYNKVLETCRAWDPIRLQVM
jgi:hypothetical protein